MDVLGGVLGHVFSLAYVTMVFALGLYLPGLHFNSLLKWYNCTVLLCSVIGLFT